MFCSARPAWGAAKQQPIQLRAYGVPSEFKITPQDEADRLVLDAFRKTYPWIDPVSSEGLKLGTTDRAYVMDTFMQIAGDIAPDVMLVNFKQSQTYISMKLLYPLDRYVEQLAGVSPKDGSSLGSERLSRRTAQRQRLADDGRSRAGEMLAGDAAGMSLWRTRVHIGRSGGWHPRRIISMCGRFPSRRW